jgi:hypothetical protein
VKAMVMTLVLAKYIEKTKSGDIVPYKAIMAVRWHDVR